MLVLSIEPVIKRRRTSPCDPGRQTMTLPNVADVRTPPAEAEGSVGGSTRCPPAKVLYLCASPVRADPRAGADALRAFQVRGRSFVVRPVCRTLAVQTWPDAPHSVAPRSSLCVWSSCIPLQWSSAPAYTRGAMQARYLCRTPLRGRAPHWDALSRLAPQTAPKTVPLAVPKTVPRDFSSHFGDFWCDISGRL